MPVVLKGQVKYEFHVWDMRFGCGAYGCGVVLRGLDKEALMSVVLLLDPALRNTGYVFLDPVSDSIVAHGVLRTKKAAKKRHLRSADDTVAAIREILRGLRTLVEKHRPVMMVAELPVGGARSSRAAQAMAIAQAVVASVTEYLHVPLEVVAPEDVKKAATGKRAASKEEVQESIVGRWPELGPAYKSTRSASGYDGTFEHVADALGAYMAVEFESPIVGMLKNEK